MSNEIGDERNLPNIDPERMNGTQLLTHYTMALRLPGGLPYIRPLQEELLKRLRRLDRMEGNRSAGC
jgi:hypothetical protein